MAKTKKHFLWLKELRIQFCTASILPIFVGTALAYLHHHQFNLLLFLLASFSMAIFQMGANVSNDYFDSKSKNDWLNKNASQFSGGAQLIQKHLLSPKEVLIISMICFTLAVIAGLIILAITKSLFVLMLGLIGLLGGFFYTAPPLKLGYRTAGEITVGFLFGILPVYGAYHIQTNLIDWIPLLPSIFVAILVFLIIFANEFPDYEADKAVNKKTLVVTLGIKKAAFLYKAALVMVLILAFFITKNNADRFIFYLPTAFLWVSCFNACKPEKLSQPGYFLLSKATIVLHAIAGLALTISILLH
ncbi:MAG: 1,4-dihydroxy-2-naphthoate octaprenyltransferase [Planctomycetes bacterium GWF2_42_9]|nr:MAG: 1,4-dihydroxy-2-naphthoate octaprenyltransferase [Planctomycetes bacterium GWF2_42_9]